MAPKARKGLRGSIDDVLGALLGDNTDLPEQPVRLASLTRHSTGVAQTPAARARARSTLDTTALGTVADLAGADAEESDISDADPQALLQSMKDLDDMDADLLGRRKPVLAPGRAAPKGPGEEPPAHRKAAGDVIPSRKPPRMFSFEDVDDPLAGLLSDEEESAEKPLVETENPAPVRDPGPSVPLTLGDTPVRKKQNLFDDGDDVMATLVFGDSPKAARRPLGEQDAPLPARFKLDELLGRGPTAAVLARPGTGEHCEFKLDKKDQKPQTSPSGLSRAPSLTDKEPWADDDFIFGAYQPTVGSARGRQPRRQSVRFSAEGGTAPPGEPGPRPSAAASSPTQPRKGGADWLGLKDDDGDLSSTAPGMDVRGGLPPSGSQRALAGLNSAREGRPSSGPKASVQSPGSPATHSPAPRLGASDADTTEDWLSHTLSRKRAQALARDDPEAVSRGPSSVGTTDPPHVASPTPRGAPETAAGQEPPARPAYPVGPSATLGAGDPRQGAAPAHLPSPEPVGSGRNLAEPAGCSVPCQPLFPESLEYPVPAPELQKQLLAAQAQLLQSQARQAELETQVRKLELERAQQRHQADLEFLETAHRCPPVVPAALQGPHGHSPEPTAGCCAGRNRLKLLDWACQQRENEELSARHLPHCPEAEQARAELSAQHQRRLAAAMQEKDQELERLRELQRASILEMRKDHEEQLQRLKQLKDREIDAVTSATSHTRSLNGIIEQMEVFSSNLQELSSRLEASHLTAMQERELDSRQRDEQLRVLQERLAREQRDMEEERSWLQEVIGRMETRLTEQSRQLEQERWRMSTEQSKAESMQRAVEEQRKALGQQMAMEREELEKAKSALLLEQKSVMQKCGEERRRLAAEWAEFFAQQKLSKERAEREAERALQVDSQREGTLVSLAKEQAELKIRATELRAKEDQLAGEREALERERQQLRLEKERVSAAALRLRLRSEEVESMSQVASEKYEEGERALRQARHIRSEQQARLQLVQRQQERLRQQEQHVQQEHLSLAQQRLQLDRVRQDLPICPPGLLPTVPSPAAPTPSVPRAPGTAHLHAKLLLLKHEAEQDHDFLENEQFFLQTLQSAPYNLSTHSA